MSNFDNLVTTIADGVLAAYQEAPGDFDTVDVTDPASSILDGEFDLTAIAKAIVTAGWVHADEVNRLRAVVDRVRAIEAEWGRHAPRYSMHSALAANQLKRALEGGA